MMRADFGQVQATQGLRMHYVQEDPRKRALLDTARPKQEGRLLLWARWRLCDLGYWLVAAGVWLETHPRPAKLGLSPAS